MHHTLGEELISDSELAVVFTRDSLLDIFSGHIDAEVEVAEVDLHVVVTDLIAAVLGRSFTLVRFLIHISQLILPLLHIDFICATSKVTVKENERGVF